MKVGKVSESVLKRSVLKRIHKRRKEVLVSAGVGQNFSAVEVGEDEIVVLSTNPSTCTPQYIGTMAFHRTLNSLLASGAEGIGVLVSILLPDGAREIAIRRIMDQVEVEAKQLDLAVIGGNTQVTAGVVQSIVTITAVGKCKKDGLLKQKKMMPGTQLVLTKWTGLTGSAILAENTYEKLQQRYTSSFLNGLQEFTEHCSVAKEAGIACSHGATVMHAVSQSGIYGALWDMASAANIGVEVDLEAVLLRQETVEVCEFFDFNPYQLDSTGSLLIACQDGAGLVAKLAKEGIVASVIGRVIAGNDKVVIREGEAFHLEPPKASGLEGRKGEMC